MTPGLFLISSQARSSCSCPAFTPETWLKVCVYMGVREGAVCSKVMVGIWVDFATDLLDRFLIVGESHHLIHTCASIQKSPPINTRMSYHFPLNTFTFPLYSPSAADLAEGASSQASDTS